MAYANPHAVTQIANRLSTTTFAYDNAGNVVQKTVDGATTTYVWDYANRLIALGVGGATTTYGYDAFGARVLQTGTSTTTIYPFKWYSVASSTGTGAKYSTTTPGLVKKLTFLNELPDTRQALIQARRRPSLGSGAKSLGVLDQHGQMGHSFLGDSQNSGFELGSWSGGIASPLGIPDPPSTRIEDAIVAPRRLKDTMTFLVAVEAVAAVTTHHLAGLADVAKGRLWCPILSGCDHSLFRRYFAGLPEAAWCSEALRAGPCSDIAAHKSEPPGSNMLLWTTVICGRSSVTALERQRFAACLIRICHVEQM
jgi:hypothetical protein